MSYEWIENVNTMKNIIDEEINEQGLTKFQKEVHQYFQQRIQEHGIPQSGSFDTINRNIMSSVGSYLQYITSISEKKSSHSNKNPNYFSDLITSKDIQDDRINRIQHEYQSKYNEYQESYQEKKPEEIDFEEKVDTCENIDELLENEMKKRQQYDIHIHEIMSKKDDNEKEKPKKNVVWHEDIVKSTKVIPIEDSNEKIEFETLEKTIHHDKPHDSTNSSPNILSKMKIKQNTTMTKLWYPLAIQFETYNDTTNEYLYTIKLHENEHQTNLTFCYLTKILFSWNTDTYTKPDILCFLESNDRQEKNSLYSKKYIMLNCKENYKLNNHVLYEGYTKIENNTILVLPYNINNMCQITSRITLEKREPIEPNTFYAMGYFENNLNNIV